MSNALIKRNTRLFGLPYQFLPEVDPRVETVSPILGRKFAENIILDAPVISIIPGKAKYLPAAKDKQATSQALVESASGNLNPLKQKSNEEELRFYDFERSYTEYMQYVNILCRTCASFLEITETIDGETCQRYDYSKYRWNTDSINGRTTMERSINNIKSNVISWTNKLQLPSLSDIKRNSSNPIKVNLSDTTINTSKKTNELLFETTSSNADEDSLSDFFANYNFVQFFVDTDSSSNESLSNTTGDSMFKGMLDSGSDTLKEISFLLNSGGIDIDPEAAQQFLGDATTGLAGLADNMGNGGTVSGVVSRLLTLSDNIIKGDNIIMPDVYKNSSYDKSYTFTVHLKTPYGTKFGYFLDICVPLMHLLALALPKQTSANTYGSPFLVKAYCEGRFTCNLGMVQSISISKGINNAYSVDGLPTEVDVSLTIADLYSDLSMSPQSSPMLFINNSSLIEYLATTCGLSLITPNLEKKYKMIVNTVTNAFADIDNTLVSSITEAVDKFTASFLHLSW